MNKSNRNPRAQDDALRESLVAQVWALSDAQVSEEAGSDGEVAAAVRLVSTARRLAAEGSPSSSSTAQIIPLDGNRARAIFRRVAARRELPHAVRLVADVQAPTDAEAVAAVEKLDALGLLSDDDINPP